MKPDSGLPPLGPSSTPPTTGAAGGFGMGPAGNAPCPPAGPPPLSGPEVGQTVQGCPKPPPAVPDEPVRIRISLFFDGTGNNRTNVALGTAFSKDESYEGSATNIALLEAAGVVRPGGGDDEHLTVYTEGIGTEDRGRDRDIWGYGLGYGDTGTIAKVKSGVAKAVTYIREAALGREIIRLHIDTFGFSRGAAAARYCIWACMKQPGKTMRERLTAGGAKVSCAIEIKFVGLFDSVASHGVDHSDDTADLHLDAIAAAAKVVHLAAAEEHRAKFRLTNINSAGSNGRQFFLPGVHSDVGGGYSATVDELNWVVFEDTSRADETEAMARDIAWLVAAGWYRADELTQFRSTAAVRANRRGISNAYSRIPLRLMAEFARENGVSIKPSIEDDHGIGGDLTLQAANANICAAIKAGRCTSPDFWFSANPAADPPWHKALRHGYLHFSAHYDRIGYSPQWVGGSFGQRKRIIQNG